jgi:hypothetical protein
MLVAVVMLFVVGAMAALSIDVVTLYTARSEAQLAADSAALAGARVLASSGMTSKPADGTLATNAEALASSVALQVAQTNEVGGKNPAASDITISFSNPPGTSGTNPLVTVRVQRTDLPTFFARIWGSKPLAVAASATAEAYNPSGVNAAGKNPVAPTCVKPWLLPNIDPSNSPNPIFDTTTGAIAPTASALLGWTYNTPTTPTPMSPACGPTGNCAGPPAPAAWNYYPGDDATTFPHPTGSLPTCNPALTTNYQESIAGCIETPISCNRRANIDTGVDFTRNSETADAVNCLTHATANPLDADQVDLTATPSPPFQFLSGAKNPIAGASGKDVMVSSSLVTVPVFDTASFAVGSKTVTIIGFVQLFLNPDGTPTDPATGNVNATIINMAGCGTDATGKQILGNGASPVAVRLISP